MAGPFQLGDWDNGRTGALPAIFCPANLPKSQVVDGVTEWCVPVKEGERCVIVREGAGKLEEKPNTSGSET
jgi:hypothetical protein